MAIHFQSFEIDAFRGIRNFNIPSLNHVNILVGDNNCGKTSILEAMMLLRAPTNLADIIQVSKQRDSVFWANRVSLYESFINIFPKDSEEQGIELRACYDNNHINYSIKGRRHLILLDDYMETLYRPNLARRNLPAETEAFEGRIEWRIGEIQEYESVFFHEYMSAQRMVLNHKRFANIVYLSPVDHVKNNIINGIVRIEGYKEICLRIIQLFDPEIKDLLILKNEQTNRPVEYIKHQKLGNMPVSSYGDGIKKVLLLANAVVQAAGGILLIDEIETAIHMKYYQDIFQFVIKACHQYDIQLFITTHNIEVVDALLFTQDYELQKSNDNINVITLKKGPDRNYTRVLSGREVFQDREAFDFEVRL